MIDQLDRYALPITIIETSQELEFGEKSCLSLSNNTESDFNEVCTSFTSRNECDKAISNITQERFCAYDYNGQGIEFQILSGPVFNLVYTCTGILVSIFADNFKNKRVFILAGSLVLWSIATFFSGFATSYCQLAIFRFLLGIGQAGCNPIATGIIADYFTFELRGSALSIYYWGIYTGYSLSFIIGNAIMENFGSWRWVYMISGMPGFLVAIILVLTIKQKKLTSKRDDNDLEFESSAAETQKFKKTLKEFLKPSLICLCIAGSIRMAAGDVWAYNNNTYYKFLGQTSEQISSYLGVIPMTAGIFGSFLGGFLSDSVAKKADPSKRIWVLVFSQIIAAPFVFGVLYFEPPYSYYSLIPTYIIGEMWIGVCLSVVVDLVPEKLRITGIGVYFFIITNIGGNMQVLVPPVQNLLQRTFDLTNLGAFRGALYIFYPGEYIVGSLLFLLTLFVLKRDLKRLNEANSMTKLNPNRLMNPSEDELEKSVAF